MIEGRVLRVVFFAICAFALGCDDSSNGGSDGGADGGAGLDSGSTNDAGGTDGGTADAALSLALAPLSNRVVAPGVTLAPIPLVITDSAVASPTVTVSGTSVGLPSPITLPAGTLTLSGTGVERSLVVGPIDVSLTATYAVTVTVDDGVTTAMQAFSLRVNAPPSIDYVASTGTVAGFPIPTFHVGVYDDGGDATLVTVTAHSTDQTFLPDANVVLSAVMGNMAGRGAFDVTLTLATSGVGSADVTLEATDPEGAKSQRTFHVSVTATPANGIELVSRSSASTPTPSNGISTQPSASGDGRYVVFTSTASDIAGGMPSAGDLYVRDRTAGTTTRLGIAGQSGGARITPDGRYIAFASISGTLVAGDTNAAVDVFVYDRQTATFDLVSQSTDGTHANAQSSVDTSYAGAPYLRPSISDDGRYVVFESEASNLVTGDTNGVADVFLRDRTAHTTTRVSVSTSGVESNGASREVAISGDGTVVAFDSVAQDLVDGSTETDTRSDVYLWIAGTTTRVSNANAGGATGSGNGASTHPTLSADGRYVAFSSAATNLLAAIEFYGKTDIYLLDRTGGTMTRINLDLDPTASQGHCYDPSISADGKRIAFVSDATVPNLINGFVNGYVYDRPSNTFTFVGKSLVGSAPNGGTGYGLALASGGGFIAFQSPASNLFPGDVNNAIDVFALALP
ncbi:MAG: hypothetical protein U0230_17320 [Polyangiales bacterium]